MRKLENKNILIVDDEQAIREILILELKDCGAKCFEANDGDEALKLLEMQKIDLIISDIRMPKMSGESFLRALDKSKKIPIIVISGYSDMSRSEAEELGVYAIIHKPFLVSEVLPMILGLF